METLGYTQRLAGYYHDLLKILRANTSRWLINFRPKGAAVAALDLQALSDTEGLLFNGAQAFKSPRVVPDIDLDEDPTVCRQSREEAFARLMGLYQKVSLNPYELQLVYGYPLVVGRWEGQPVLAPLFTMPCRLEYQSQEQTLSLVPATDELSVNGTFWLDVADPGRQVFVQENILPNAPELPLDSEAVLSFIRNLGNAFPELEVPPSWSSRLEGVPEALNLAEGEEGTNRLAIVPASALLLVKQSNYYGAKDLADLKAMPEGEDDSVLSYLWSTEPRVQPPAETEDEERLDLGQELIFPFGSNEAQRQVMRAIEDHRAVVVQGPPGTGKSLTICNVISHLVATGRSVLVTSQKNKSLEVISQKLKALDSDYLALTMLKDDPESKDILNKRLMGLDHYLQGLHPTRLKRDEQSLEGSREEAVAAAMAAFARFLEMQGIEAAYAGDFASYHTLKAYDLAIEGEDPALLVAEATEAYRRFWELRETCLETLALLDRWHSALAPEDRSDATVFLTELEAFLASVYRAHELRQDEQTRTWRDRLAETLAPLRIDPRTVAQSVAELMDPIQRYKLAESSLRAEIANAEEWLEKAQRFSQLPPAEWTALLELLSGAIAEADELLTLLEAPYPVQADDRMALEEAFERYEELKGAWYRLVHPKWKPAIATLRKALRCTERQLASPEASESIRAWLSSERKRDQLTRRLKGLPTEYEPKALLDRLEKGDLTGFKALCHARRQVLELAKQQAGLQDAIKALGIPSLTWELWAKQPTTSEATQLLAQVKEAIALLVAEDDARQRLERWHLGLWAPSAELLAATDTESLDKAAEAIRAIAGDVPAYHEATSLLGGPLQAAQGTMRRLCELRSAGDPLADEIATSPQKMVDAYALRLRVDEALAKLADSTDELAKAIGDRRVDIRNLNQKLLRVRINRQLQTAMGDARAANDVQYFRQTLRSKRKNYKKFEELKKSFDFQTLLRIFPCWIVGIDDVSRVFPLSAGLFDVLIVDEASQCHTASALGLMHRAKKLVVVGDEHQLPNADMVWMQISQNEELMNRHRVQELPRYDLWDARANSLLETCSCYSDRRVFLNEHFRCHPDIIRFSNEKFYDGRLRVLTDRTPDALGAAVALRLVEDADDDMETRVNRLEAETLVSELLGMLEDERYANMSFGVLSLFREQANYLEALLRRALFDKPDLWKRHQLIVSTVDGFQGDERDVILYSFRFGPSSRPGVLQAIQNDYRRINVAFTRAKRQAICYVSRPIDQFPVGHVRDFLVLATAGGASDERPLPAPEGALAKDLAARLSERGLGVIPGYPACGFRIDLVVERGGTRIAIETDDLRQEGSLQRQEILERAGWNVIRIPASRYWADPEAWVDRIGECLGPDLSEPAETQAIVAQADDYLDWDEETAEGEIETSENPLSPRPEAGLIDKYSRGELLAALLDCLDGERGMRQDDLLIEAAKRLGFRRMGTRIRERLSEAYQDGLALEQFVSAGDFIYRNVEVSP